MIPTSLRVRKFRLLCGLHRFQPFAVRIFQGTLSSVVTLPMKYSTDPGVPGGVALQGRCSQAMVRVFPLTLPVLRGLPLLQFLTEFPSADLTLGDTELYPGGV